MSRKLLNINKFVKKIDKEKNQEEDEEFEITEENNLLQGEKLEEKNPIRKITDSVKDTNELERKNSISSKEFGGKKIDRRIPFEFEIKDQKDNIKKLIV